MQASILARHQGQQQHYNHHTNSSGTAADSVQQFGQCKMKTSVLRQLIEDYRKCEVLWNSNLKNYYNKSLRQQALQKLAQKYQCTDVDINSKIKNLRTYFLKEWKKTATLTETGQYYQSTWFAYESMMFVKDHIKPRRARMNQLMMLIQDAQDCANQDQNELEDDESEEDEEMSDIVQLTDDDEDPDQDDKYNVVNLAVNNLLELQMDEDNNSQSPPETECRPPAKRQATQETLDSGSNNNININLRSNNQLGSESEQSAQSGTSSGGGGSKSGAIADQRSHSSSSTGSLAPWLSVIAPKRKNSAVFASPTSTTTAASASASRHTAPNHCTIPAVTPEMDECAIFGALVAQKLRNLPTPRLRSLAQNRVCNLLFELEMTIADCDG